MFLGLYLVYVIRINFIFERIVEMEDNKKLYALEDMPHNANQPHMYNTSPN